VEGEQGIAGTLKSFVVKTLLLYLLPLCWSLPATHEKSEHPLQLTKSFFRLGDQVLTLEKHQSAEERNFLIVSLHNDEEGFIQNARSFIESEGGALFILQNGGRKDISVELLDRRVAFDPNGIFTVYGRKAFKPRKGVNFKIDQYVAQFARFIVNELGQEKHIVDIHGHEPGEKDISGYQREVKKFKDIRAVHVAPSRNGHTYFLTSDEGVFERLKGLGFNCVLQSNYKLRGDGSLNEYCRRINRAYVRVVTVPGDNAAQREMLQALSQVF